MKYVVIQSRVFAAKMAEFRLSLDDLRKIENEIAMDPKGWPVVRGAAGLRKMRFAAERSSGGKSGGYRICYFLVDRTSRIYLLTLFAKNEMENLKAADLRNLRSVIAAIKSQEL